MLCKVWLGAARYAAGAHIPGDGDRRKRQSEKAEHRDGKEDIHDTTRRITRCTDFVQVIQIPSADLGGDCGRDLLQASGVNSGPKAV